MADETAGEIARVAARRLAGEYGPHLETEVEAALYARESPGRTEQYDPVAIGALIVEIAQLAWTLYSDRRKTGQDTAPEIMERVLHNEIRHEVEVTPTAIRVTEVVVKEIIDRDHA